MKSSKLMVLLAIPFALSVLSASAAIVQKRVPAYEIGMGKNGSSVVAESGSIVYARSGSNVQYWPGSKLVPASSAAVKPDCSQARVETDAKNQELMVGAGAQACTDGDTAVIAFEGATVIYDDDVPLIRRPVRRR